MSSTDTGAAMPSEADTPPNTGITTTEDRTNTNSGNTGGSRNRGTSNNASTFRMGNFKGEVSEIGAVIGTKSENRTKDSMILFQEKNSSYMMWEYKKGIYIIPLIKKIEEVDISKWKPTAPTLLAADKPVPEADMLEYKLLYNEYLARKSQLADN